MSFDFSLIWNSLPLLLAGAGVTIEITAIAVGLGFIFGLITSVCRLSGVKILQVIAVCYVNIIRGTPMLVQIFLIYFALPMVGIKLSDLTAALFAFTLNYAAYFAEIFRAGIQSINRGQYEAAKTLGMSYPQTMQRIILPQVIRRVLPPISNETINLVKDTSLIYILAMNDLLRVARTIVQREFDMTPFIIAGIFYLGMTLVLTAIFKNLEKKYAAYDE